MTLRAVRPLPRAAVFEHGLVECLPLQVCRVHAIGAAAERDQAPSSNAVEGLEGDDVSTPRSPAVEETRRAVDPLTAPDPAAGADLDALQERLRDHGEASARGGTNCRPQNGQNAQPDSSAGSVRRQVGHGAARP